MPIESGALSPQGWRRALGEPVDGAGLAVFRLLFGLVMLASALRFLAKGWVRELYVEPSFHFTYLGFSWVKPWPEPWMSAQLWTLAALAACIALGFRTRLSAALYFALFTYAELIEKSAYLNHYYLVSLVSFLLIWLPSDAAFSLNARRQDVVPARVVRGHYVLLRAQLGIVYVYAGLAKLNGDWLFRAQPLRIWLRAYEHWPVVGGLLARSETAFAMSYVGAAFDLCIVFVMLNRKTRPLGWVFATIFHLTIGLLFPIGVFSFVMLVALSCFNAPDWPRPLLERLRARPWAPPVQARAACSKLGPALAALYLLVQALVPARFVLYPGPVNWTEEGFRFAWRVMLIEKSGHVEFRVRRKGSERETSIQTPHELTLLQRQMMSTQPDMVLQYAQHLARSLEHQDGQPREVRADAWVAYNGRPSQRFIDPSVDLAQVELGLSHADFILPLAPR